MTDGGETSRPPWPGAAQNARLEAERLAATAIRAGQEVSNANSKATRAQSAMRDAGRKFETDMRDHIAQSKSAMTAESMNRSRLFFRARAHYAWRSFLTVIGGILLLLFKIAIGLTVAYFGVILVLRLLGAMLSAVFGF